jgi:ABC-type transport auxiliary lipoprotein component
VNCLIQTRVPCPHLSPLVLFSYGFVALLWGCATPATFEGMVPTSFQTVKNHSQTVRVNVTGGQETVAIGRPQITNSGFTQALTDSITKSRTFSRVIEDQSQKADYLLTVTLFSMDKLVFGRTVKMEAGWTLRRADTGTVVWQESIISEHADADIRLATEGVARNNIAEGLRKISKLNFQLTH